MFIEEIDEEDEYYEEEIISYYDTGLSTIPEGDNESCTSSQADSRENRGPQSPGQIPDQISLSPNGRPNSYDFSPRVLALVSPTLFSAMAEARKLKFNSFKSPSYGRGGPSGSSASPSPGSCSRKSPTLPSMPLVLTNLETGEELIMEGDDDEYTFVSCSDIDSAMGASASNMDEVASLDPIPSLDESDRTSPQPASKPAVKLINADANGHSNHRAKQQLQQQQHVPPPPMDFETTKARLENALKRRKKKGRIGPERMDYVRRRLRYDLNRRMFKERMNQCLVPSKRRTEK